MGLLERIEKNVRSKFKDMSKEQIIKHAAREDRKTVLWMIALLIMYFGAGFAGGYLAGVSEPKPTSEWQIDIAEDYCEDVGLGARTNKISANNDQYVVTCENGFIINGHVMKKGDWYGNKP